MSEIAQGRRWRAALTIVLAVYGYRCLRASGGLPLDR